MSEFKKAAKIQDIDEGEGVVCEIEDKSVAVFKLEGQCFAIDNVCPHKGGPLGEGELDGSVVTCPWHGWEFDIKTGCSPEDENAKVKCYPVKVEGEDVLVEVDY